MNKYSIYFEQIHAALVSIRDYNIKSLTKPNILNSSLGLHILIWTGTGNVISFLSVMR